MENFENIEMIQQPEESGLLDVAAAQTETENIEEQSGISPKTNELGKEKKLLRLPLWKVKKIMKIDPDTHLINKDAAFLTTKATELFIEYLSKEMYKHVDGKRKTVMKKDFDAAVNEDPNLCFLDGTMGYL